MSVAFIVAGVPAPKGSMRARLNRRTKQAYVTTGGSAKNERRLRTWGASVKLAAREALGADVVLPLLADRPLAVSILFRLARPAGHYGTGKNAGRLLPSAPLFPRVKPDIDKLTRATLDAMTGVVFDDDARIVVIEVRKCYADGVDDEGATIGVTEAVLDDGAAA